MNLRSKNRQEPDINLTPLIDVVFLMLIFFMVSTTFEKESALQVSLPKAEITEPPDEDMAIEVTVNANGEYFINRAKVPGGGSEALKAAIEQAAGDARDIPFSIRGDEGARWQSIVTVMDVAGRMGFTRLSMPTLQPTLRPPARPATRP